MRQRELRAERGVGPCVHQRPGERVGGDLDRLDAIDRAGFEHRRPQVEQGLDRGMQVLAAGVELGVALEQRPRSAEPLGQRRRLRRAAKHVAIDVVEGVARTRDATARPFDGHQARPGALRRPDIAHQRACDQVRARRRIDQGRGGGDGIEHRTGIEPLQQRRCRCRADRRIAAVRLHVEGALLPAARDTRHDLVAEHDRAQKFAAGTVLGLRRSQQ